MEHGASPAAERRLPTLDSSTRRPTLHRTPNVRRVHALRRLVDAGLGLCSRAYGRSDDDKDVNVPVKVKYNDDVFFMDRKTTS